MSRRYHLAVDLAGRRALVVGGGPVALRRCRGLLEASAQVVVVAPHLCPDLQALARDGALEWVAREWQEPDVEGAWLVQTATGVPDVDESVAAAAARRHVWCVRADDAAASAAWTPAVARAGDVSVAVTAGADPRRAARLAAAVSTALHTGALPLRRHRRAERGLVSLVGGGPGDPGLITTRGRRRLAEADVVVVDRLAPRALLDDLDEEVLVLDVGKTPEHHPVPQREINALLVEHALAGRRVVRLKGGDPYVLGRGGEEALACLRAGVAVEVVPGVTSAVAVPAAAGIPVTHRGVARQVTVATGHDDLDWPALARVEGTLVLLMGVGNLTRTAERLLRGGRDPATPVAVVESGCSPAQRTTIATLGTVGAAAAAAEVRNPAVVVVGEVVGLAAELSAAAGRRTP